MNRFNIKEKADYVGTLRALNVYLMEMVARWTPSTPELEVKVLFGRHLWDFAQHADMLGKRAFELRAPLHHSVPPGEDYRKWLQKITDITDTPGRVAALYEVVLPAIAARHQEYLRHTDPLQDEPTVRILQRIAQDHPRMMDEHKALLQELPNLAKNQPQWSRELKDAESKCEFVRPAVMEVAIGKGV
jgi:hypothetical protein